MNIQSSNELLQELIQVHKYWKEGTKNLKWWRMETAHYENIRKLCKIPLSHPDSNIQINCIYILHLNYIYSKTAYIAIRKKVLSYRIQVFKNLALQMNKQGIQTTNDYPFPWHLD